MTRPLLVDLFCCEGGAAGPKDRTSGYAKYFDVVGVDIEPQPNYPFAFTQADALDILRTAAMHKSSVDDWCRPREWREVASGVARVAAYHASPPCQAYTTMSNRHGSSAPQLIDEVRALLEATGKPYVIENVVGARRHMRNPLMLHGGMFGLNVYRPRLFESNVLLMSPPKAARPVDAAAVYGRREDRRLLWKRKDGSELRAASLEEAREAMGMPWASWNGVREAIPPAYTEWIGAQLLAHVQEAAA